MKTTAAESEILAGLLGHLDGQLEANHIPEGPAWQADWQNARAWHNTGLLPWRNPGIDGASRKRYSRALASLEHRGLVRVATRGGHWAGLSPEGESAARSACGLPSLADSMPLLDFLGDPKNEAARWIEGYDAARAPILSRWLSESSLVGGPAYHPGVIGEEWVPVALASIVLVHAAPLLSAGLVQWRTVARMDGVYLYAVTDTGQEIAADRIREGTARPAAWLEIVRTFKKPTPPEAFLIAWQEAWAARQTAKPTNPNAVGFLANLDAPKPKVEVPYV